MSTPIRQLVKKTLSPRLFKSPNSTLFLNTPSLSSDILTTSSPSKTKSLRFCSPVRFQNVKEINSDDLEFCKSTSSNCKYLDNRLDEFIIRKPNTIKKTNHEENTKNKIEINHSLLFVPNNKDVPSVNTPEREEFLKSDLSKLNLNVLGKGSFGTVVQAVYKGNDVALKIIRRTDSSLLLEANALTMNHPNILQVLRVEESEVYHLVVMQNCSSLDMQHLLDNSEKEVSFEVYSKWVLDICSALQYCHQRRILHLDVKPKNILMKNNTCILCDFGNSLNLNSLKQRNYFLLKVKEGHGSGTVAYSAPELLQGTDLPTTAADVYSLAVTMCHIQTRTPPFDNLDNVHTVIYQVVKHNLRPLSLVVLDSSCDCKNQFRLLYMRCWAQVPAKRPALSNIVECLQQIIEHHKSLCL